MTAAAITYQVYRPKDGKSAPKPPRGIVVGVDGSPESLAALNTASAIAFSRGCPLHVMSVMPAYASYRRRTEIDQSESEVDSLRINIREVAIQEILEKSTHGNEWTQEVVAGRAPLAILKGAERRIAELIVLGRHPGPTDGLDEETALQVIRQSAAPVLAVERELTDPRVVVVATDFSPASTRAARLALDLLKNQGRLYLVHVEPAVESSLGESLGATTRFPGDIVVWFREQVESLQAHRGVIIETVVLSGQPAEEVIEFAARVGADLIAGGTQGRSVFEQFTLGSVATAVIRKSKCSVLFAPPG